MQIKHEERAVRSARPEWDYLLKVGLWLLAAFLSGGITFQGVPLPIAPALTYLFLTRNGRWGFVVSVVLWLGAGWGFGLGPVLYSYLIVTVLHMVFYFFLPASFTESQYQLVWWVPVFSVLRLVFFPLVFVWPWQILLLIWEVALYVTIFKLAALFIDNRAGTSSRNTPPFLASSLQLPALMLIIGSAGLPSSLPGLLLPLLAVLLLVRLGEGVMGVVCGLLLGVFRNLAGTGSYFEMGFFPVLGLAAYYLRHQPASVFCIGLLGVTFLFSEMMGFPSPLQYIQVFGLVMIICGLILFVPAREGGNLRLVDNSEEDNDDEKEGPASLLEKKAGELARVFKVLAGAFRSDFSSEKGLWEGFMDEIMENMAQGICAQCPKQRECWEQNYNRTHNAFYRIFNLFTRQENFDNRELWRAFGDFCIDGSRMLDLLKQNLRSYRLRYFWQREIIEQQKLLTQQMEEMGEVICDLGRELKESREEEQSTERKLKKALLDAGFKVNELSLVRARAGLRVQLMTLPCGGNNRCLTQILSLLKRELGCNLGLHVKRCGYISHRYCNLHVAARSIYRMEVGMVAVSSSREQISGDRFSVHELNSGKFIAALSDGMGTGYTAARESEASIKLLENILKAGFSHELAIRSINATLNLRSKGESYATMDLVIFDEYTGRTLVIKVGAAPSLLRHRQEVFVIKGEAPPLGVLKRVQATTQEYFLEKGDLLLLLSDGVLAQGEEMCERMQKKLIRGDLPHSPQAKAETLLKLIKQGSRQIPDDITLLLLQVEERR